MKKLVIGIDANEANVANRVGTGQYTYNLLWQWYKNSSHDLHLYLRDPLVGDMPPERGGWSYHIFGPRQGWTRLALPIHLLLGPHLDVFWNPAHYLPPVLSCPSVVTVHDLAYEYFPSLFLKADLYKLKNWTRRSVAMATRVIAVSGATKKDLMAAYNVPEDKISVVHNGYNADVFNIKKQNIDKSILENWKLKTENYLLFLGTLQPRKNAIKLIQAFHLLKKSGYKGKLVLAGNIGWMADETMQVAKESPEAKDIVLTGYVSDETRRSLYAHADVYVLPSLYEGFGVPALEAMACGAPVAVANNSSLPEVVGDAAETFNPTDPEDIARAIATVRADRETYIQRGLARAKHFSWEKCAAETLAVLESVA